MSSKHSRPADGEAGKAPLAKKAKIPFGRLNRRGQVIDHRVPVPKLEGFMDEPITDRGELIKLLTASTRQTLLENVMKNDAARAAIFAELQLLLPKVVKDYTTAVKQAVANATKHLRVDVDGSDTSDGEAFAYKKQEVVDCDEYPKAVAPFLKKVHTIARIPTQNAAQEAMELLLVIAQESMPEGKNHGGWRDARERFDKAVDEMFVLLANKRKDLKGDASTSLPPLRGLSRS